MKSKTRRPRKTTAAQPAPPISFDDLDEPRVKFDPWDPNADWDAMRARRQAAHERLMKLPPAQIRAYLISRGILTKEGKIPRYPMDHVPYGPTE
jgi:hypothetical protein